MDDFQTFINNQRDELQKKRNALVVEFAKIEDAIATIDKEFVAIQAYEDAKKGKPTPTKTSTTTRSLVVSARRLSMRSSPVSV